MLCLCVFIEGTPNKFPTKKINSHLPKALRAKRKEKVVWNLLAGGIGFVGQQTVFSIVLCMLGASTPLSLIEWWELRLVGQQPASLPRQNVIKV